MEELIKTFKQNDGSVAVDGRDLHDFLEVDTQYTKWIDRMIEYGFTENVDFTSFSQKSLKPSGGRPQVNHALTLDMAKELSMIQRTDRGKQARQYFIAMEKRAKAKQQLPQTPEEKIMLLLQNANEDNKKINQIDNRVKDLEHNKPLTPGEYNYISHAVGGAVNTYVQTHHLILTTKQRGKLYKDINGGIKQIAGIQTRAQLREKDFENVDRYIRNWVPSTATILIIKQLSEPVASNEG
ncbi:AntA/AntB antirepressor [Lentilactobacillus parabuchneri]|uniref:AntA/AntB antirepressor n=1 Tax=Lentilactobacillus parabuchneri TaxID=152331 RepID=A0A1X1FCN1_9LACO|nr:MULTISPECIES: antA/AntB antirepressor family protein [Lentilactobacillus]ORN06473.1 AntA/AntB antirepressor [Lentilactobacillus parabuchneri]ORN26181.1 AntA/AntB antirepressor [Lentilactobacillus parabuchneri]